MTEAQRKKIFEELPISSAVLRQICPAIAAQMVMLCYNLADTYFVGLLNAPVSTAAVTISTAPFLLLTGFANLFGVGGAAAISRALGEKNIAMTKTVSSTAFWSSLTISVIYSLLFFPFGKQILCICGATEQTLNASLAYANWTVPIGGPATVLSLMCANLLRAEGSTIKAFVGLSACGILNVILDPLFTLPQFLGMGVAGAGLATALSNFCSFLFFLSVIIGDRNSVLSFSCRLLRDCFKVLWRILAIGFPSAVQLGLTVLSVAIQAKFVSKYSVAAIAALGIAKKMDQLPLFFSLGVSTGIMPLLAYNDAAGNYKRCRKSFLLGTTISVVFSLGCLIIFEIWGRWLAAWFIDDAQTIDFAAAFLRCLVIAMPLMAICYPMIILFQAMGKAKEALICSLLRKGLVDIPVIFVMDCLIPLYGCMCVQPIVDTIALICTIFIYRRIMSQRQKQIV